jgi:hypothetical protein
MHLVDGQERDIPLALSLVLTDEPMQTPTGTEYVIDGAFVVDEEGGPYTFVRVSYDIENNRLDMKYSRPRGDPTTTSPASLRLVGSLQADGGITGNVTSGVFGPIGTFRVMRDPSLVSLPHRNKYIGTWRGIGHNIPYNEDTPITISLQPSASNTVNPPGYEFDFTPGHLGGLTFRDVPISTFNQVVIDYLRRKILMIDNSSSVNVELSIDFDSGRAFGSQTSGMWGLTTTFSDLRKVP